VNRALLKRISRHTDTLSVAWLKSLLSEEEAKKVSLDNIGSLLPDQYHFMIKDQNVLAPNSPKWIRKQLKKMVGFDPNINIEGVTLEELKC
jgi:hypothetical protein